MSLHTEKLIEITLAGHRGRELGVDSKGMDSLSFKSLLYNLAIKAGVKNTAFVNNRGLPQSL